MRDSHAMSAVKEVCAAGTSVEVEKDWDIPSSIRQGTLIRLSRCILPSSYSAGAEPVERSAE